MYAPKLNATKVDVKTEVNPNSNSEVKYLSLQWQSNIKSCKGTENFGITFNMKCNSTMKTPVYAISDNTNECNPVIDFTSKYNCNLFDTNAIWRWCESNWWIVAISMIVIGGFQWAFGQKLFKPTLFLIGTISVLGLVLFVFYAVFLPTGSKSWTIWVVGAVGLLLGLILGYFLAKLVRVGVAALGAWIGVILALLIHSAFLYSIHSQAVFLTMLIGFGIVFGGISFWKYKLFLMFGTAFIGSYLSVRGVSLFAGGYPNEFTMINQIHENGGLTDIHWPVYVYLCVILLMTAFGIVL